jgi:hypothetical protein
MQGNFRTIHKFFLKIKRKINFGKLLYFFSLLLFPFAGYLIGKGEKLKMENPDIIIDTSEIDCNCDNNFLEESINENETEKVGSKTTTEELIELSDQGSQFVASKNGEKYYPVDCASANRIKEENKVYYETATEAEADGKELSSQCQ